MTASLWISYVALLFVVCITPGPAVILTSAQAAGRGFRTSFPVIAGIQAGNLVYFILSAIGLGATIAASETAFLLIKYIGAVYLFFLGLRALLSRPTETDHQLPPQIWRRGFIHGLANQLANPKSVLFYAALLPQFIVPGSSDLFRQLVILAATGPLVEVPILLVYAGIAARGGALAGRKSVWSERLTGGALIAAAAAVLLTRRTA